MYSIYKITSNPTVDFAAEELKKYLRMMMPRCGEITIERKPDAKEGFRLGLMQDFSLDVSEAEDVELDDIVHIDTDREGGIIAGSNPRSVLLAVYRYLTLSGCRWLFPGIDGEFVPVKEIEAVKYHKMADSRYRGWCNEGAEFQPDMMETIDFAPKLGMNIFMIEFDNPKVYYKRYYDHNYNTANREPEPVTDETVLQWKRQCEAEISKRGLQFHDMGHGWTAESFGISSVAGWSKNEPNSVPPESVQYLAEINGVRDLNDGVALNTNFCMSNPKARAKMVDYVCDYAERATNVDYLHVWLSDGVNNHCECSECQKMIPSDFYVILMNDLDAELTRRGLDTRIVFCCYVDTTYPPEHETLNNPDRFLILLGAITRNYVERVSEKVKDMPLGKYLRNKIEYPGTVDEYILYANEWSRRTGAKVFAYEYHFHYAQCLAPGIFKNARLVFDDVNGYRNNGISGIIQDGTQRCFFPNGFSFYVYAETLFDKNADFEAMKADYFSHAYGEDWREVVGFIEKIDGIIGNEYLGKRLSADPEKGSFYNPSLAEGFRSLKQITDEFCVLATKNKNMPKRAQTVAYRVLLRYIEYIAALGHALTLKCLGADDEAREYFRIFFMNFGRYEIEMERYYDHCQYGTMIYKRILAGSSASLILAD